MNAARRIVLILTLVALGLLVALSVAGAFAGQRSASALFNSPPLVFFWTLLAALLVAGFASSSRLRRSPWSFAAHAGTLLVLLGAMAGSNTGHAVAARFLGAARMPGGYMLIREGETSNTVTDLAGRELGALPFSIRLTDFSIEYYPPENDRWLLVAQTDDDAQQASPHVLDWRPGAPAELPGTDVTVEVLRYLPSARPVYPEGARGVVRIEPAGHEAVTLPAEPGREARLGEPPLAVRVDEVYTNLKVTEAGAERRIIDAPGEGDNPAVRVTVIRPDGASETSYLFAFMPAHPQKPGLPRMRYVLSAPADALEAPGGLPAVRLRVRRQGVSADAWLVAEESSRTPAVSVAEIFGLAPAGDDARAAAAIIYLAEPAGQVRDYRSALEVVEEGAVVRSRTIEVNHPLHYGGYHFYQFSYDTESGSYTVLSVTSDAGLHVVYAGFVLLLAGLFGLFWVRPATAHLGGHKRDGN